MDIRGTIKSYVTGYYMVLKQRERVCKAAKEYVDDMCGDVRPLNGDTYLKLEKEIIKLRALEGE